MKRSPLAFFAVSTVLAGVAGAQTDCSIATAIADGDHVALAINTLGAGQSGVVPSCGGTPPVDIWFSWSPSLDSDYEFSLCNAASFDTRLALYSACGAPDVVCNDDFFGCAGLSSLLQAPGLLDANTYYLQVGGYNAGSGTGQLDITGVTLSPPLANDTCATAMPLAAGASITAYDTTNAQDEQTHVSPCSGSANPHSQDVWYSWTPDVSGAWNFSLCGSSYNTLIQVWDDCAGSLLACNDDSCGTQSSLSLPGLVAGTSYWVQVGGFNRTQAGTGALDISALGPPPANDDCSGAIALAGAQTGLVVDTSAAFASGVVPSCGGATPPNDLWYAWTPGSSGDWQFTTCNTNGYDTRLALFTACNGVEVACNDDGAGCGLGSILDAPGLSGATTYFLQVGGFNAAAGTAAMDIVQIGGPSEPGSDYCPLTSNSVGAGANMTATGSSSVAANDLTLVCDDGPPSQPGVFYYGPNQIQVPFGEGNRCVGGTVIRLWPPVQTDGTGSIARAVDNSTAPNAGVIVNGTSLNFQFWFRDPLGGGSGFNLSNGYNIVLTP